MTDADRQHLAAILGMLGSEHAGERAAAALKAEEFRARHKATWNQLVSGRTIYVDRIVEKVVYRDRFKDKVVYIDREVVVETVREVPIERVVYFRPFEWLRKAGIDRGVAIVLGGIPLIMILATFGTAIRKSLGY